MGTPVEGHRSFLACIAHVARRPVGGHPWLYQSNHMEGKLHPDLSEKKREREIQVTVIMCKQNISVVFVFVIFNIF